MDDAAAVRALEVAGAAVACHRVNHVRAGRTLRPAEWPGGARCAVALSFDSDHETNELRDGGKSIARLCWGQYGNRVGVPRILAPPRPLRRPRHVLRAGGVGPHLPDEQRRVVGEGHELGIHGWIHEAELGTGLRGRARSPLLRSADTPRARVGGTRPVGMRTPSLGLQARTPCASPGRWGWPTTLPLMADEDCHELLLDGEPTGVIRAARGVGARRRRVLHDAPLPVAQAVHAARRRARHLPP